jgi:Spy/CpxP family protein refolding chaperone
MLRTAAVAAIAAAAAAGLTILATGADAAGSLHRAGARLHGHAVAGSGAHDHHAMEGLADELGLTPDQRARFDRVHALLAEHRAGPGTMEALHHALVSQLGDGGVDRAALRQAVDDHVDALRAMLHAVTGEMVALVDSLDARQRAVLDEHLRRAERRGA